MLKIPVIVRGALVVTSMLCISMTAFSAEPASKAVAAAGSDLFISAVFDDVDTGEWQTILETTMRPADGKDLFITASMQTGLFQFVAEEGVDGVISLRTGGLKVKVLVDGVEAAPGTVTWDRELKFQYGLPNIYVVELALRSGVRSFTFVAPDVGPGEHTIELQAKFVLASLTGGAGVSANAAFIKHRTLTVESVRLPN